MGKVIDITKRLKNQVHTGRPFQMPNKYCIFLEYSEPSTLEFCLSDEKILTSKTGPVILVEHIMAILMSVVNEDPSLIAEVLEIIEEYTHGG